MPIMQGLGFLMIETIFLKCKFPFKSIIDSECMLVLFTFFLVFLLRDDDVFNCKCDELMKCFCSMVD